MCERGLGNWREGLSCPKRTVFVSSLAGKIRKISQGSKPPEKGMALVCSGLLFLNQTGI